LIAALILIWSGLHLSVRVSPFTALSWRPHGPSAEGISSRHLVRRPVDGAIGKTGRAHGRVHRRGRQEPIQAGAKARSTGQPVGRSA
jgi:hypothetical protein